MTAYEKIISMLPAVESGQTIPAMLPLLSWLAFTRQATNPASHLWLVSDDRTALEFLAAWKSLAHLDKRKHLFGALPSWGAIPYSNAPPDKEKEYLRVRAEILLSQEKPCLLVASAEGATNRIATLSTSAREINLAAGKTVDRTKLAEQLVQFGFSFAQPVTQPGEFCIKGSIIDIFSPEESDPVRLDFFGDEVESIKLFSHETQRSFKSMEDFQITPLAPQVKTIEGLADRYPELTPTKTLPELWLGRGKVFLSDGETVSARLGILSEERNHLYTRHEKPSEAIPPETLFVSTNAIQNFLATAVTISDGNADSSWRPSKKFGGRLGLIKEEVLNNPQKPICFLIENQNQQERLKALFSEIAEPEIVSGFYPAGFENDQIALWTENDVFGRIIKKYSADKKISKILDSYTDLKEGDYVVHVNYGIGKFHALKRMRVKDVERDFLELSFAESDKLFVPLDQLSLVHKYIGSTENPRLDYLGKKSSWTKTRARVKRLVDALAGELIELYALRSEQKGFEFPPDTTFQHDFEAAFPYSETEHQLEAIYAIKRDMESAKPMDRLVCGDVGFGKTEVAIRAAFKAAMAGKQVAILCPTTILAFQHYRTFSKRFADYPVTIDFLSRFRTANEVRDIKERMAKGKIDIIIGTHALLAADVQYKNLGLMIVDEEQRFGVGHKERLRQMKNNLDSLALTATPIPRSLHMSLAGIRDLTIIETPPADRRKIETHVLVANDELLQFAIKRELARGGQVYILHNKVATIEEQAMRIRSLNPKSRVAILHGQMPEIEIEEVMIDFYQHAYDILVSTTIIESGIDIPNVNTLIVLEAHLFGLSQLYQLKGRVGRSERQAYAYFFFNPNRAGGTGNAERRLEVLAEYDDLGSGFKIAMKDLEIRGAGNLLGKEQSGEIMEIGFELYSQMLAEKIDELRGRKTEETYTPCIISLKSDWYFPNEYIADTREKMEFYKRFSAAETGEEFNEAREALLDRFGKAPEVVELMLSYEEIRHLANTLRLEKIALDSETSGLYALVSAAHRIDMGKVAGLITRDKRVKLDAKNPRRINFNIPMHPERAFLQEFKILLYSLLKDESAQN